MDALFKLSYFPEDSTMSLVRSFFTQVHTQSQMVHDRRSIFHILEHLLTHKIKHLEPLRSEFVMAFIQAVDAEKDPVNMSMIFAMWPRVLQNFTLEPFEEDVFEAMSCYFPIDFSPPRGLEIIVSKEDLVLGLRKCLSTSAMFAPLAMPLFLEKLESDLTEAKIDANLTMIECVKRYSPEQLSPHLSSLWELLKKEILGIRMNVNEEVIKSCHWLISQVTLSLCNAIQSAENRQILEKWMTQIWDDVGRHLNDIELKFSSLSIEILCDLIRTGKAFPSMFLLEKAMPVLFQVYRNQSDAKKKSGVLTFIAQLFTKSADSGKIRPQWYDPFLQICILGLQDLALEKAAASALEKGSHFMELANAQEIFDSIYKSDHLDLILALIKQCQGSRPTNEQLEDLYQLKKAHNLAAIYKNPKVIGQDYDRILSSLEHEFGLEMMQSVVQYHDNVVLDSDFLGKLISATITSGHEAKILLLKSLAPKIGAQMSHQIEEILSHNPESLVLKSLIAYATPDLINALEIDSLKKIMNKTHEKEFLWQKNLWQVQAAIVNKSSNPEPMLVNANPEDPDQILWIAKGLLFRTKPYFKSGQWVEKLLNLLDQGIQVDFSILTGPLEEFLQCPTSRAQLARQKIFSISKPRMVRSFTNKIHPSLQLRCLICQLPHVPKFALGNEMSSLLPLLIQSLSSEDQLSLCSLSCLKDLLDEDPSNLTDFMDTLIPIWIEIASGLKEKSIHNRIKALECIKSAAKGQGETLLPLKKSVLKGLVPALSDHKRLVRQTAASARNKWCIL